MLLWYYDYNHYTVAYIRGVNGSLTIKNDINISVNMTVVILSLTRY